MPPQRYPPSLHLSFFIPPSIALYFHSHYDSREISSHEINSSHDKLAALSHVRKHVPPVIQSSTGTSNGQVAQNLSSWNLLQNNGVLVIPNFLNGYQSITWKSYLNIAMKNKNFYDRVRNDRGRLHCHQESRKDPYNYQFQNLAASSPELRAIVKEYFQRYSVERYQLTQCQFLVAKPGSEHQIWHRDNIAPGLTLLVALDNVNGNGPTEFLLGSHLGENSILHDGNEVLLGCLKAGDAILYDARLIHRGRGYKNEDNSDRPVLILRWDSISTPPPGGGLILTNYVDWLGYFRSIIINGRHLIRLAFGRSGQ